MQTANAVQSAEAGASPTSVATSGSSSNGANLVSFPDVIVTDHTKHPFDKEAFDLYFKKITIYIDLETGKERGVCRRHFLPMEDAFDIARALGRQITVNDLNVLVALDGDIQTCSLTKIQFQPVRWLHLFDFNRFIDETERRKAIAFGCGSVMVGCFFPSPDLKDSAFMVVSGVPTYWRQKGQGTETTDWKLWDRSPLFKVRRQNDNRFGLTAEQCLKIVCERDKRREQKQGINREISSFFRKNGADSAKQYPKIPQPKDWQDDRPGQQRDRRPFLRNKPRS